MKKSKLSMREILMIVILSVILLGTVYYLFFYFPHNAEMYNLDNQINEADTQINDAMVKAANKKKMEAELKAIFEKPQDEITEIAPYDNKEAVLTMLYGILSTTKDYSLSFQDPNVEADGTVRRHISMSFSTDTYEDAKEVLQQLSDCPWRCLISNLSITGDEDMLKSGVSVSVNITFFERAIIEETVPPTTEDLGPAA